ncbi:MAG TPA: DUF2812 domain-containing protein [Erysipelotrichaceae bacterium]|nr:DUF2812 domain-containing protein [Erysipelotrichaceae bacterium]
MKTKIKKTFLDIDEEEKWLNQQGENSLMMIGYYNGVYEFEDVSPTKYQYKIDIPDYVGTKRKEYLEFLEEGGVSVAAQYSGRVYLRKNTSLGPLEIYTEKFELYRQAKKRYGYFFTLGIAQFALGVFMLVQMTNLNKEEIPYKIVCFFGVIYMIAGIVLFGIAIKKHLKNVQAKKEIDLWE